MGKHIALFVGSLYGSGVQRAMLRLARAFSERGQRVDLLVCTEGGHLEHEVADVVRVVSLPPRILSGFLETAVAGDVLRRPSLVVPLLRFGAARHLPALVEYLRSERPDAILAAATPPNLMAILGRQISGVRTRVVVSERNHLSAKVARFGKRWKLALIRHFYPAADAIVAVSHGVAADLATTAGIAPDRISTIYNPVVDASLLGQAHATPDHPWMADDGPPVVLGVGKLESRKDFATLLRAFARLRERRDARLLILGEGSEQKSLRKLASQLGVADCVDLPGFVSNPFAYMQRAGVLVLSSCWEGLPNVLIEALACGCPVVSTDCPSGPAEILEDGIHGALVPIGDDLALAEAIAAALEKPPSRERLQARAASFSIDAAAGRYHELLLP